MSLFSVSVVLRNAAQPDRQRELSLPVDPGSLFTWVAAPVLEGIGVAPVETRQFQTITGVLIERRIGHAILAYNGRTGAINVVFAEPGDREVLGVTGLESLTMTADPVRHVLVPIVALAV